MTIHHHFLINSYLVLYTQHISILMEIFARFHRRHSVNIAGLTIKLMKFVKALPHQYGVFFSFKLVFIMCSANLSYVLNILEY